MRPASLDRQLDVDARDPGCRPGCTLCGIFFRPGVNPASERDDAAVGCDLDALGFPDRLPRQRVLNPLGQISGRHRGFEADVVDDAYHPRQGPHHALKSPSLEVPVQLAAQGHPTLLYAELDSFLGHRGVPAHGVLNRRRDFGVAALMGTERHHVKLHRHSLDAADPLHGAFGRNFLRIGVQVAGEGHHAVADGHSHPRLGNQGIPRQFRQHILLQFRISFHRHSLTVQTHCKQAIRHMSLVI